MESEDELEHYAFFAERLVGQSGRNAGEASVLAYARAHSCAVIIDDGAGRRAGLDAGVEVRGTLGLLTDAIRGGRLTLEMVSHVADDLLATEYRLPFRAGGFAEWTRANGLG
ncbi:nucleotide-binding protein [Kocuria tytonicola]|uniref:nucleotide-binding protein n=1 Tax=Kocuria tytonicola TaxID=2055946 RepID=UPI00197F9EB9|nr:nucleotide-binding protein [Kocuria tytonicola]